MSHKINRVAVKAFTVPTKTPESDGTLEWHETTIVLVNVEAGGTEGLGYSYADVATAQLIENTLASKIVGMDALAIGAAWQAMVHAIRNLGRPGICSMAIAAVDNALWDLKGKLLNTPWPRCCRSCGPRSWLTEAADSRRTRSGNCWTRWRDGSRKELRAVKMKIGRDAAADVRRVEAVRQAIGPDSRIVRRCEWRVYAQAGAQAGATFRRIGSDMV